MCSPAPISVVGWSIHLTMACELAAIRPTISTVRQSLAAHGLAEEEQIACELALVEACNNAVLYATPAGQKKPVAIDLLINASRLELQVTDHTREFDWPTRLELPQPEAEHGRGLFIIQSLMEEVCYLRGRDENRLILRKWLHSYPDRPPSGGVEELKQTQEKLALTEQVINSMARELYSQVTSSRVRQQEVDQRLLAHELEIARKIQHSLLPKTFPSISGFELGGFCLTARQVGGDFFDVLSLSPDLALLVVADVMGKGVPAALFAATLRTLVRTTAQWTRRPARLLRRINGLMFHDLSGVDMFITAQLVLADARVGRLVVANAGHCPLLLTHGQGEIEAIAPEGMPLGIVEKAEFEEEIVPLSASSCALLYTDGLVEARNPSGDLFGNERLCRWLQQSAGKRAGALIESLQAELNRFQGNVSCADDQTLLLLAAESRVSREPETALPTVVFNPAQPTHASL